MSKPAGPWIRPAGTQDAARDRGLVELFLVDEPGEPTKVALELYPPGRQSVSLKMLAHEAAGLGNSLLDAADQAEKANIASVKKP